ncbi:MAG: prepilin peptidase [Candidatus Eremiobacteraeota bacterium]|nr:prepilin peptidase [Candidatus Eremiobacteraeota bacterium]
MTTTPSVVVVLAGTLVAALIDARTGLIPDALTRSVALLALGLAAATGNATGAFFGALLVGGGLLALHAATRGRGLGLGDVKLGIAIGTGFGPAGGSLAVGTAFVLGGAYATWLLAGGHARRSDALCFGPFLAAGTFVAAVAPRVTLT